MQTSTRYGVLYPSADRSDSADVPRDFIAVVGGLERTAMYGQGTLAGRPISSPGTPGIQGRFYMATDQSPHALYYDYGTGWDSVTVQAIPSGVITDFAGAIAPSGWLLCDGSAVSRAAYSGLYAALGAAYGAGDGATTFNLPDLRGRVSVGVGPHASVDSLGENEGVAAANRRPHHRTSLNDPGHHHSYQQAATINSFAGGSNQVYYGTTNAQNTSDSPTGIVVGTGNPSDPLDTPAFITLNKIIKV